MISCCASLRPWLRGMGWGLTGWELTGCPTGRLFALRRRAEPQATTAWQGWRLRVFMVFLKRAPESPDKISCGHGLQLANKNTANTPNQSYNVHLVAHPASLHTVITTIMSLPFRSCHPRVLDPPSPAARRELADTPPPVGDVAQHIAARHKEKKNTQKDSCAPDGDARSGTSHSSPCGCSSLDTTITDAGSSTSREDDGWEDWREGGARGRVVGMFVPVRSHTSPASREG
jgi:hypothetical protein